jgi:hypothetical protein
MKILINIVVLSLFLMLSDQSYATLGDTTNNNTTTMPDAGLRVENIENVSFFDLASIVKDYYYIEEMADLPELEEGTREKFKEDLTTVYQQLMFGTLELSTNDVKFTTTESEIWTPEGYKTQYTLTINYNFNEDGQEYQKRLAFRYEFSDQGVIIPRSFSISQAEIDVMNPPIYYYHFREDGVQFQEAW